MSSEIAQEAMDLPLSPPFEQCVFLAENFARGADLILLIDQRTATHISDSAEMIDAYASQGILQGDQFISVMPCIYRADGLHDEATGVRHPERKLSFWPVELHFALHRSLREQNTGLAATPSFAAPTEAWSSGDGQERQTHLAITSMVYFMLWLLSKHEVRRLPGLAPRKQGMKKPKGRRVFYEHHVIDIDPFQVRFASGVPTGLHRGSPRFHAVRGFWRHYKEPIKAGPNEGRTEVWIPAQWRGDKLKGVITKDYNIVRTHG
jgi:hypothetical protein